ncbi:MAG: Dienelactone hydrolase [Verrucomicrobia bacterium]|nr:MAG: Dienelactone hydrolase [Verrucomicrobiota bacterium]
MIAPTPPLRILAVLAASLSSVLGEPLPGTGSLEHLSPEDRSASMVAGISQFLDRQTAQTAAERASRWTRDFSSRDAYETSIQPQRDRLARIIGAVEPRMSPVEMRHTGPQSVQWSVVPGFSAQGILISPANGPVRAAVVMIPDADQDPVQFATAHTSFLERLGAAGCEILIPLLINRDCTDSGNERAGNWTNLPHREWIYRQGFDLGRHIIGYEVQEILAAVDWFKARPEAPQTIGCIGYGEGGLLALHAAALDPRINVTLVSGYFAPRQDLWQEPIYRNLFGIARDFGDAELATLIFPRALIIENAPVPALSGRPPAVQGRAACAAPGNWSTPENAEVAREFERTRSLVREAPADWLRPELVTAPGGEPTPFGSSRAVAAFLQHLPQSSSGTQTALAPLVDVSLNHTAHLRQLEDHLQNLLRHAGAEREKTFWKPLHQDPESSRAKFTRQFKEEVIGWFDDPRLPLQPRSRELERTARWTSYEVRLDVWPEVFAWGYLLVPTQLAPGERRAVVVCQHGLEGLPGDVIEQNDQTKAWQYYKGFGAALADRGYVVFAPHNPYRGRDAFRDLQRKANPLGRSLFSIIGRQHETIVDFLASQPFIDPARMAFYGLSYGGKSAMRLPILEPRYALSICSGDFNEWVWKNATIDWRGSYVYAPEHEIFEWNLGHTLNYAEMAALIAPRPFMVERGHRDGVGLDEWVAFEYAKVRRYYADLKIPERTVIEWFDGPHTIHGVGTFAFLERHLGPPRP